MRSAPWEVYLLFLCRENVFELISYDLSPTESVLGIRNKHELNGAWSATVFYLCIV